MKDYVSDRRSYAERLKKWEQFGKIGTPPTPPNPPPAHLLLYLELRRWQTHQIVPGGIMDQPAWTWDLMQIAGHTYDDAEEHNRRVEELLRKQQEDAAKRPVQST